MTQQNLAPQAPTQLSFLDTLNPAQREAATAGDGALLILAGAGTGKTRVLTARLAFLIGTGKARAHEILSVTFTNKAAKEMRERVSHLIGGVAENLWMGTFHSISVRILRRYAERIGLQSNFTILDMDDQLRLCKQLLQAEHLDEKKYPPRVLAGIISRWKDKAWLPSQVPAIESAQMDGYALKLYKLYQARLQTLNAVDFGDLLLHTVTLFLQHADVLQHYQQQFRYVLVDEYQDTNVAQYLWLRLLAQGHGNLCCVGDDDQSIYGWRGAEVENILRFSTDFPNAVTIRLEQNYRSTPHILGAASGLISYNEGRLGKTLWTETDTGEQVHVVSCWDGADEARRVGEEIEQLQRKQHTLKDMAILVRAGYQTREFEERLLTIGVPYRVIGGLRFYERQEIKDALAYLRLIYQPRDALAFERIINVPKRGVGTAALQSIYQFANFQEISLVEAAALMVDKGEFRGAVKSTMRVFLEGLQRWRKQAAELTPSELTGIVLDESGYTRMWKEDKSPDAAGRLENLKELVAALEQFDTLGGFLEHVSLVTDTANTDTDEMVSIMTLHSAKGLEFPTVFLPGWEEGVFPSKRSLDEKGTEGLEEERRLAYVGITRARERAYIFHVNNRRIYNQWQSMSPSRFINELPAEHVAQEGLAGVQQKRFDGSAWGNSGGDTRQIAQPKPQLAWQDSSFKKSAFEKGERVYHASFGYGDVLDCQRDRVRVAFDEGGEHVIMVSFIKKVA